MYVPGGTSRTVASAPFTNIAVATYSRVYVRPMEKHELELVTSTCTMSSNVMLQDCTRHNGDCLKERAARVRAR
jgi:glycine cleavage system protein P-like pyridoxal-binding family